MFSIIFLSSLIVLLCAMLYFSPGILLTPIANFLIVDEKPQTADAVVVLNTGMGIYERLVEAADLYNKGFVGQIIINGNRKNELVKELEEMGLTHCCPWDEGWVRVLNLFGVPRKAIISISAEDVYDTITEAKAIGPQVISLGIKKVIITTSKTHTARAIYIWRKLFSNHIKLTSAAAQKDEFTPDGWWKSGEQVKTVLYEYGSWLYLFSRNFSLTSSAISSL